MRVNGLRLLRLRFPQVLSWRNVEIRDWLSWRHPAQRFMSMTSVTEASAVPDVWSSRRLRRANTCCELQRQVSRTMSEWLRFAATSPNRSSKLNSRSAFRTINSVRRAEEVSTASTACIRRRWSSWCAPSAIRVLRREWSSAAGAATRRSNQFPVNYRFYLPLHRRPESRVHAAGIVIRQTRDSAGVVAFPSEPPRSIGARPSQSRCSAGSAAAATPPELNSADAVESRLRLERNLRFL